MEGAPDVLNTLKELADAIGDDANYAANLLMLLEKTTTGGTTNTNIYTNDQLQIKVKGNTGTPIADLSQTAINLRRPLSILDSSGNQIANFTANNIQFNKTVNGITKGMVGMGNVDNTSDANKHLSLVMMQIIESVQATYIAQVMYFNM